MWPRYRDHAWAQGPSLTRVPDKRGQELAKQKQTTVAHIFLRVFSFRLNYITFTFMQNCWKTKSWSKISMTSWYGSLTIIKYALCRNHTLSHTSNTVCLGHSKNSWFLHWSNALASIITSPPCGQINHWNLFPHMVLRGITIQPHVHYIHTLFKVQTRTRHRWVRALSRKNRKF